MNVQIALSEIQEYLKRLEKLRGELEEERKKAEEAESKLEEKRESQSGNHILLQSAYSSCVSAYERVRFLADGKYSLNGEFPKTNRDHSRL